MKTKIKKKGAIELSMSTIVVVIIAIVLLSLGLVFVRQMMIQVTKITEAMFRAAQEEIEKNMGDDQKFYVPGIDFEIRVGGKQVVYAGIQNLEGVDKTYTLRVSDKQDWFTLPGPQFIGAGEMKATPFIIQLPKTVASGDSYLLDIQALSNGQVYDSQTLIINVK